MQGGANIIYKDLSYNIVGVMFEVFNELGYGYQEKHYERAAEKIFVERKINYKRQLPYNIIFHGEKIGIYYLDFLVEDKIIVEVKAVTGIMPRLFEAQVLSYLKITGNSVGLLINFGNKSCQVRRLMVKFK